MKTVIILILCLFLVSCASLRSSAIKLSKEDLKNVKTCRTIGENFIESWPCKSAFLTQSLGPRKGMLPKNVLDAWAHLDEMSKKPKADLKDQDKCGALGDGILMASDILLEALKVYAPDLLKYLPAILGI